MDHPAAIWLVRAAFQRGLAAIYLVALVSAFNQFSPLLGDKGLLPAAITCSASSSWNRPASSTFTTAIASSRS